MTIKQQVAAKEIAENHRSVSSAMEIAGYKPNTFSKPKNLTQSKAWPQLLEQYLPDDKLLGTHEKALEATKWNDFTGEREEDHTVRLKAVELGYKVKGKLHDNGVNIFGEKVIAILGGVTVPVNPSDQKDITTQEES
jgi:hypothetical protein